MSCRYGWLSLCGLRSTNPGLVPHQGAPGHLAQRLPPVSGRDYLPAMDVRCAVMSSGFEWVECVVFTAQGNSPTWAQLSWQHASLNSLRVATPEASVLWPKHWAQIWGGLFLLPLVFVFCTKRTTRLYICSHTDTDKVQGSYMCP